MDIPEELDNLNQKEINLGIETILNECSINNGAIDFKAMTVDKYKFLTRVIKINKHQTYSLQIIQHLRSYLKWCPTIHPKATVKIYTRLTNNIFKLLNQKG